MGLAPFCSFSDKENAPPTPLKGSIKKKHSPRRKRRVPLQDITHLFNRNHFSLSSALLLIPSSTSSASSIHVIGCRYKRISADSGEINGDEELAQARASAVLRKDFR